MSIIIYNIISPYLPFKSKHLMIFFIFGRKMEEEFNCKYIRR